MKNHTGEYWAVQRGDDGMPCLFGSREDAEDGRDPDERLVRVIVQVVEVVAPDKPDKVGWVL